MSLYTSLQACRGFSKVHNSHITNSISSKHKLLTCILLVQSSYNKHANMAFTRHLSATNNLGSFNHSMVYSTHLQVSNNLHTVNHQMLFKSHFQNNSNRATLTHNILHSLHLLAKSTTPIPNYQVGSSLQKAEVYYE